MAVEKPWWWRDGAPSYYTPDYLAKKEVERRQERGVVGEVACVGPHTFWIELKGDPMTGGVSAYCLTATWIRVLHFWRHPEGSLRVAGREACGKLSFLPALKRTIDKACHARAQQYRVVWKRISDDWHQWETA